jgi:hypothetical protein
MSTNDIIQTQDLTIVIPAGIAALPDLRLVEKAALAHIAKFPACSNGRLSKLTGLSVRGVEALLARLRKRDLVQMAGKGRARRLVPTCHVEHHIPCGEDEIAQTHKLDPAKLALFRHKVATGELVNNATNLFALLDG